MRITSKNIFDYVGVHSSPILNLDWICDLDRRSSKRLSEVLIAFKAGVLVRICRPFISTVDQPSLKEFLFKSGKENIKLYAGFTKLKIDGDSFIKVALQQMIDDFSKDNSDYVFELSNEIKEAKQAYEYIYAFSCESLGRRGTTCTPQDVASLMARLAGEVETGIDVYCNYGYGLFLGAMCERGELVSLVGSEIGQTDRTEKLLPGRLNSVYQQSKFFIDHEAIYESMCIETAWNFSEAKPQGDVLLVNATTEDYPLGYASDNDRQGELNFIFNGNYRKIIVLVSNTFLNGGRGFSSVENLSKYFQKNGLVCVFELPAGCIGAMHERHSILIFEPKSVSHQIQFRSLDLDSDNAQPVFRQAPRGFGNPLRKVELNLNAFSSKGETDQQNMKIFSEEFVFSSDTAFYNQRNRNHFISFEASRFLQKNQISSEFKNLYKLMKLEDLVSIRRVQHLEISSDPDAILCHEISSDDINEFGILGTGKVKYVSPRSMRRLENSKLLAGDILLCIRGPVGKVALVRNESTVPMISTQNFLRLRIENYCEIKLMTPEFLFWWLRSDICQRLIKNFELAAGVLRLSMRDIENLEVPTGPDELLRIEIEKFQEFDNHIKELSLQELKVREISSKAFL